MTGMLEVLIIAVVVVTTLVVAAAAIYLVTMAVGSIRRKRNGD